MKNVGAITSGERGELVTAVYAICAAGYALAPMLIYLRVHNKDAFIRGAPPGTIGKATKSGWINEGLFVEFLDHISDLTCCSEESKILVILDNHKSYISLAAIDKARKRGIVLLTIPPKISHKLQPLDKSVFSPFKASYNRAADNWMRSNPGKRVTIYEIADLIHEAHLNSLVPRNILSEFRSTGNWPYNPDVLSSADFAPAVVTDNDVATEQMNSPIQTLHSLQDAIQLAAEEQSVNLNPDSFIVDMANDAEFSSTLSENDQAHLSEYISPANILPLPKAAPLKKASGRRRGKTRIFTDTPVRNEVAERARERNAKKTKKSTRKSTLKSKKQLFRKKIKTSHRIEESSSSSDEVEIHYADDSDCDMNETVDARIGDYVVVLVTGKARALKYIARRDNIDANDEYEGVFLSKVNAKIKPGEKPKAPTFVINEEDGASFSQDDIVFKLPLPIAVGGSARRSSQLRFDFDFNKVDLA